MPEESPVAQKLRKLFIRHQVSLMGANQFLQEHMVTDAKDRNRILHLVLLFASDPSWVVSKIRGNPRKPTVR